MVTPGTTIGTQSFFMILALWVDMSDCPSFHLQEFSQEGTASEYSKNWTVMNMLKTFDMGNSSFCRSD